jgi:hypothetical protein
MRLPRMTTRRWMIAVAALSLTLGGYREATRLKRVRDEFLARATEHVAAETYYRRLASSSETSDLGRKMEVRKNGTQELVSDAEGHTTLDNALDLPTCARTERRCPTPKTRRCGFKWWLIDFHRTGWRLRLGVKQVRYEGFPSFPVDCRSSNPDAGSPIRMVASCTKILAA